MSKLTDAEARQKRDEQLEAQRSREAAARPDAFHRAVIFILKAIRENNPDFTEEVAHHIATLDSELAVPARLVEIEKPAPAAKTESAAAAAPPAPDTAKILKQSRRFKRG